MEEFTYSARDTFGDDEIHGGSGDDEIFGQLGADTLYGNSGHDVMFVDFGSITRVTDQDGNPLLNPNGSWRKEFLLVSPESGSGDIMQGGEGDDTMFGGAGDDFMYGHLW